MENLGKRAGVTDASITNRIQEMEERISGIEDTIENIDTSVKENSKCKTLQNSKCKTLQNSKLLTQNIQEIQDTMKRSNLRIIGIEEDEDSQLKWPEIIAFLPFLLHSNSSKNTAP